MLSAEERDRIREEMLLREEIRRELAPGVPTRPLMSVLNSPFVVAFVGALLIAYVGRVWQDAASRREIKLSRDQTLQDRRYDFLGTFCQDFEKSYNVWVGGVRAKLQLKALRAIKPPTRDVSQQIAQLEQDQRDRLDQYLECRSPNALFMQLKALFSDQAVLAKVGELDKIMLEMHNSDNEEELENHRKEIDRPYSELVAAMGTEIKGSPVPGHRY